MLIDGSFVRIAAIQPYQTFKTRLTPLALLKVRPMKLADWLKTANMSKAGFARAVGISPGRVSQLLSGDTPSLDLALRIQQLTRDKVKPGDLSPQLAGADTMTNKLDTVSSAIAAIKAGEMVVVVDDDDRENEGDLIAAASKVTTEQMAMMVRHGSGIVCAPMTREDARRLKLDPMVSDNDATAFSVHRYRLTPAFRPRSAAPPYTHWPTPMCTQRISCGPAMCSR
jgi:transcriptional regulator with XRE-family HTH domain